MAASPLTQEVSRGCFLPDGTPILFGVAATSQNFCSKFFNASKALLRKWLPEPGPQPALIFKAQKKVSTEREEGSTSAVLAQ